MKRLWIGLLAFLFVASAYGCGCSIGGFVPDEDPVSIAICDDSASGSGTADITCSTENGTVITGGASGGNTISHTLGDDAPGSIPVTVYGSCSHGSSFSTSGSVEYEVEPCAACSNSGDGDVGNNCIKVKIYLGKRDDGKVAGYFWLYTNNPSPMLSTPAGLTLIKYRDVEELTDTNGILKQVMAPQCFVDIVTNNVFKYSLNFYSLSDVQGEDTNGYYTLKSGCQPFAVWELENPNTTNDCNILRITKIIGTESSTNDFTWQQEENGATAWGLSQGGGLRDDYLSSVTNGSELVKTRTVKNNNGIVASKSQDIYSELSDGKKVLVSKVEDPDGASRTTTYSYYDDEVETGKFGKFSLIVEPTGAWTKYDYAASGSPRFSNNDTSLETITLHGPPASFLIVNFLGFLSFVKTSRPCRLPQALVCSCLLYSHVC